MNPTISADGRYVVYLSKAANLVPSDTNGVDDCFLFDRVDGTTTRITVSSSSVQGDGNCIDYPKLSDDGSVIVFVSSATNLVAGDTNGQPDVFTYERATGTTRRVSIASSGAQGDGRSDDVSISGNGLFVAFASRSSTFVAGDGNGENDVYLRDLRAGTTTRISVSSTGGDTDGEAGSPQFSFDGRFIVFDAAASNVLPGDTNSTFDIFLYDTQAGAMTLVSRTPSGQFANGRSLRPKISSDGRYVAFSSTARDLVSGDPNGAVDAFVVRVAP